MMWLISMPVLHPNRHVEYGEHPGFDTRRAEDRALGRNLSDKSPATRQYGSTYVTHHCAEQPEYAKPIRVYKQRPGLVPHLISQYTAPARCSGVGYDSNHDRNSDNEDAYRAFVSRNSTNPEFKGEFVAFVHGKFQGQDRSRLDRIYRMYDKFGNVPMYVGRSSGAMDVAIVTPTVLSLE